jgi:hypothetical protein
MQRLSHFVITVVFLFIITFNVAAQEPPSEAENKSKQEATAKQAFESLKFLIVEARALKLPENRAALLANALALLWPYDEKAARALLPEITTNVKQMFAQREENTNQYRNYYLRRSTREHTINLVARIDLEMALELARITRPVVLGEATNKEFQQAEVNLEQNLAQQIAAHNPDAALRLAEQSLEKGVSYNLRYLLNVILKKSPAKATALLDKTYKKLETEDLLLNIQAASLATSIIEDEYRAHNKEIPKGHALQGIPLREPALSQEVLKKWTELVVKAYLAYPSRLESLKGNSYGWQQLQRITPFLEFISPELVAPVQAMFAKLRPKLPEAEQESLDAQRLMIEGKVDELVAMAQKMPPDKKDQFLWNAIHAATDYLGDADLASKVIDTHVTSEEKKKQYREFVAWFNSYLLAEQGKVEEIIASLTHISSPAEKARTLARIAGGKVKSKTIKIELLEKALLFLGDGIETTDPFSAYCYIASLYAQADLERGLALFEPQIDPMNKIWEAAALYCSFENNGLCRAQKGELYVLPQSAYVRSLTEFVNAFRAFGKADFSRAYELTQRIKAAEVRCNALLAIIESHFTRSDEK